MDEQYETLEIDLNSFSKDKLISIIEYANTNRLTFEQTINRFLIIWLITHSKDFTPSKVSCTRCGKMFYGDSFSKCFRCQCAEDSESMWRKYDEDPDDIQLYMIEQLDECLPNWMIVDENNEWLKK